MSLQSTYDLFADSARKESLRQREVGAVINYAYTIVSNPGNFSAGRVEWAKSVDANAFANQTINTLLSNPTISAKTAEEVTDNEIEWVVQVIIVPAYVGV